eukprot:TRINITY_DN3097_c0_g2_i2.p1 TRINITY_DN3097_c0_g2~~TRINITY_DN3097_c0_g2_i2.p1  ORF type:complete len:491 (-),score=90.84 TRINITY_DN3097_c0_g2_i2:342-1814(-)
MPLTAGMFEVSSSSFASLSSSSRARFTWADPNMEPNSKARTATSRLFGSQETTSTSFGFKGRAQSMSMSTMSLRKDFRQQAQPVSPQRELPSATQRARAALAIAEDRAASAAAAAKLFGEVAVGSTVAFASATSSTATPESNARTQSPASVIRPISAAAHPFHSGRLPSSPDTRYREVLPGAGHSAAAMTGRPSTSPSLNSYSQQNLEKLERFQLQPSAAEVAQTSSRSSRQVQPRQQQQRQPLQRRQQPRQEQEFSQQQQLQQQQQQQQQTRQQFWEQDGKVTAERDRCDDVITEFAARFKQEQQRQLQQKQEAACKMSSQVVGRRPLIYGSESGEKVVPPNGPMLLGHPLSQQQRCEKKKPSEPNCRVDSSTEIPQSLFEAMERLGHEARHRGQHILSRGSNPRGRKQLVRFDYLMARRSSTRDSSSQRAATTLPIKPRGVSVPKNSLSSSKFDQHPLQRSQMLATAAGVAVNDRKAQHTWRNSSSMC